MGEERERNERGQFEAEHTDEEVVAAVRKLEPAGTKDIADELGVARQSADYRLRELLDEGRVVKEKIGNSLVWSVEE